MNADMTVVLADIGGTNTRVALGRGTSVDLTSAKSYRNADYSGIGAVLRRYLAETGARPQGCCVAVAGPVRDSAGRLTNIDWSVDREMLHEATGAETLAVLNDLQAQGHALGLIAPENLTPLLPGQPASPRSARLVVGVGTGMNAAPVYRLGDRTLVPPAEAGHATLGLRSEDELRLFHHVSRLHAGAGIEHFLSGRGFERIWNWLCSEDGVSDEKPAAEIMALMEAGDPRALRAVETFSKLLGRVCGDLALTTLPFGGIFLIGGVARHFGPHLVTHGFADGFRDKGRFSAFMDQFPVHLLTDDYAALTGCACHLSEQVDLID
ncbi:glucokinase [Salipiger aestuarii]|uniref:Glucokinase n=2 Tax=Salipiger aestuarii TaxID=568098 RepID=A0A327YYK1_9RHOB|nr:glucokinase [Salipiger aestuarii]EIE50655.1 glucokinase [Citreicella sp. 357]KAA8607339.1 glucokinase [Salipiger aestuarii]KAB2543747.1 glucokinase [Salipiger aestuarii]RAK22999.1 glucokinase [Salipiger aestuarii]